MSTSWPSSCCIGASDLATWIVTTDPPIFDRALRTRYMALALVLSERMPASGCDRSERLPGMGSRSANAERYRRSPAWVHTWSQGLFPSPGSPSNQVSEPSGLCSTISAAHWRSLRSRSSSVFDALRLTMVNTLPAYRASTTTVAPQYHNVRERRTLRRRHHSFTVRPH